MFSPIPEEIDLPRARVIGTIHSGASALALNEALLDSLAQVSGAPTDFTDYPAGWRALQLPDSNVASYFLKAFGRPEP